jgi:hypothetical protein
VDTVKLNPERPSRVDTEFLIEEISNVWMEEKDLVIWWRCPTEFCVASANEIPDGVEPWHTINLQESFFDMLETVEQILMAHGYKMDDKTL